MASGSYYEAMIRSPRPAAFCAAVVACLLASLSSAPVTGQDVEMLARMYGTTVPAEYFARRAAPDAFEFSRAFRGRTALVDQRRSGGDLLRGTLEPSGIRAVMGPFHVPVVMGLYSDSPSAPFDAATVQGHFFDGPNPTGTISDYYTEASGGRIQLQGAVFDWKTASLTQAQVAGGSSGLGGGSRVAEFIAEIVAQLDAGSVDWGAFDNDGPDGLPNSGDDDGFVDVLAVLHPTSGAECAGSRDDDAIWSHRWSLAPQLGSAFVTSTPSASGGFIRIDDYTVQPVKDCSGSTINQIGVFTHELGHGFGLPDLYAVGADHPAVGQWDLMATGSWGCPGIFNPARPCMMGAWTRATLGWTDVLTLDFGSDHGWQTLQPAGNGGAALRVRTGGDDYFLLENRQPQGFDAQLPDRKGGLLVWHVDANRVSSTWPSNTINSDPANQGIRVVQADGLDQLSKIGDGRGDAGDIFPGLQFTTEFHAGSNPASFTNEGIATGVTLRGIEQIGDNMRVHVLARLQSVVVQGGGAPAGSGWVRVDGGPLLSSGQSFSSAPFQQHSVEALAGVALEPGVRLGFGGWSDGASRTRTWVTGDTDGLLSATYAGREVELTALLHSDQDGVVPGSVVTEPASSDGWFPENSSATVEARPRTGFEFRDWSGAVTGATNPATVVFDAPKSVIAHFDLTFKPVPVPTSVALEGGALHEVLLQVENGNQPIVWTLVSGALPDGLEIQPGGRIAGVPVEPGVFPIGMRVVDGIGLEAQVDFTLDVRPPSITTEEVARGFTTTGEGPTLGQRAYFDAQGNANGVFDLGDLRALIQSGASLSTGPAPPTRVVLPAVPLNRSEPREGGS